MSLMLLLDLGSQSNDTHLHENCERMGDRMSIDTKMIETNAGVWGAVMSSHKLDVWGSFSDPEGSHGQPTMETIYSLKGADCPFIQTETTWDKHPEKECERVNEKHRYWLHIPINDD